MHQSWRRLVRLAGAVTILLLFFVLRGVSQPESQTPLAAAPPGALESSSRPLHEARRALPERFLVTETRRFVVLSDANPIWTRKQAQLLERTYHQFHRFTRRLDLEPAPVRHKLVCVLFRNHRDYKAFARRHDDVTAEWISGYYSPKHDRIVFYDLQSEVASHGHGHAHGHGHGHGHGEAALRGNAGTATTIHEAIHQLIFHTGIQSARIQNPLWISEGLATAFETDRPHEPYGPDRDYTVRVKEFQRLLAEDALIPLRQLLQYTDMPDERDETITAVYHQSYALVTWMNRFRKRELRRYLDTLREEPPGRPTGTRHLEIFTSVFGDPQQLERKWLRYERGRLERFKGRWQGSKIRLR